MAAGTYRTAIQLFCLDKVGCRYSLFYQDEHFIREVETEAAGEWRRYKVVFTIEASERPTFTIGVKSALTGILLTAPQMESGERISQYQPTDGRLSYTEDYGAWFCKGGIGGTIQNPLLRLNEDGSICSRDGSFVILPDGTGHFAGGKFSWTDKDIVLKDITIRWGEMDDETKENILSQTAAYTVEILTDNGNHFINGEIATILTAYVYKGSEEITETLPDNLFHWKRTSANPDGDTVWNELHAGIGRRLAVSDEDVDRRATFTCEVTINT